MYVEERQELRGASSLVISCLRPPPFHCVYIEHLSRFVSFLRRPFFSTAPQKGNTKPQNLHPPLLLLLLLPKCVCGKEGSVQDAQVYPYITQPGRLKAAQAERGTEVPCAILDAEIKI